MSLTSVAPAIETCTATDGVLSAESPLAQFCCGDFTIAYALHPRTGQVGLRAWPTHKTDAVLMPREVLNTPEVVALPASAQPFPASRGEISLVQVKIAEDDQGAGFGGGRSMRANPTVDGLRLINQTHQRTADGCRQEIRTTLAGERGFRCVHVLSHEDGDEAVSIHVELENTGSASLTLEMLSSFSLDHLSPFDTEDSVNRLRVHRFRSSWSYEGRHEAVDLEDLHLERSWINASVVTERFGQVGSMPVRGWFPFVGIEDKPENVFWAAQLACGSSWQMEIYRRDDKVSISGGLADREFGHWMKTIAPGECFITPIAFLTTATGDIDSVCQRLVRMQEKPLRTLPAIEQDLPIIFNEWCSSWGSPTPAFIAATAEKLRETPVKIFVIDDGWAEKPDRAGQFNGDWNIELRRFPDGLAPVAADLHAKGFVAGLWFEFEVCTEGTKAFKLDAHKLRRDGRTLRVGTRHFWDFTDPWTFDYLTEKVINRLRDDGFSYLKVDYNDTLGLGADHPDSLGEGLRLHIEGVQNFFRKLRAELPDLIIEVCSSGGHRLEPSFLALGAMGSFSDAHECPEIPIIAANLHRLIPARQNQIWAVLHASDSLQRLHYSLAATFLGRVCLSGEICSLDERQFEFLRHELNFYERVKHLVRDGESRIYRDLSKSWRQPRGWQAVIRVNRGEPREALVVVHAFKFCAGRTITFPLPGSCWQIIETSGVGITYESILENYVSLTVGSDFSGCILHLARN